MKNSDLSQKLKELRMRKGFSQEQLAEAAQINLRTVQRVENGETEPRGDTLRRIANALNVTPDELIDWTEQEDRGYLVAFNLSALSFLLFPVLGVIIPFALWILKKDKIRGVAQGGKKLLNFQITGCMIYYLPRAIITAELFFTPELPSRLGWNPGIALDVKMVYIFMFLTGAYYGTTIIYIVISAYRAHVGKPLYYKPAIPFLR